ncbi:MAG: NAD(P)-dependent alcohol dehydrogenase [Actinobacteria bacterium HGW-Actinobacteria-6]|nr:MAG: NAD(P)-dependent alcohol dehydrogenase [Actinobacteria bacterium HGW-Actinobacteria-6]
MKAAICTRYGPPEVLQVEELATPVPRKNEVRVRIGATAVTSSDTYVRGLRLSPVYRILGRLALGWNGPRQPVLGMVLSGVVDSVGANVRSFKVGDRVFGFNRHRFGTYAQYVCWPQGGLLAPRPANLTDEEAAAIPYGGLLAAHFLRKAGVRAGQRVLVFGASGAVGTSAVQLARHLGAEVTGVCSSANVALVASLGATRVIDYTGEDFVDRPERYDVVLDAVGKRKSASALRRCRHVLAPGGTCVSVDDGSPKLRREDLVLLGELAEKGAIKPVIDRTYALEDIVDAHTYVDTGHKRGNVIVSVTMTGISSE